MDRRRVVTSSSSTLEQHWIDEVRYLHSLWHQGPPSNPRSSSNTLLPPTISTETQKKKRKKRRRNKMKKVEEEKTESKLESKPVEVSEFAWPCEMIPESQTGWPVPVTQLGRRELSVEEQTIVGALQLQQKGLKASQDFFSRSKDSDGEDEDEDEEDDDLIEDEGEESEEFKFFLGVFTKDSELRSYYEKNYENGEFCCLVCGGIGKKNWKRFKNCVALVQHSTAVSKTKRKRAHRAFGQVLCWVIGWDLKRIPNIVLSSRDPLGRRRLAQADDTRVVHEEAGDKVEEPVNLGNGDGVQNEQLHDKTEGYMNPDSGGGDQNVEILDKAEGSVNPDNEGGDHNEQLLDKVEESVNLDNGDEESVIPLDNEKLCDKAALGSVDATINDLTFIECEAGRKDDDANDQRKDHDKENVNTNGEESYMDSTVSSIKDDPDSEHKSWKHIHKEIIDTANVTEELVDHSG